MAQEHTKKRTALVSVFVLCFLVSLYELYMVMHDAEGSGRVEKLWSLSFAFLLAYWAINDARLRRMGSPYSKGFLMFFLWPVMLPAYLLKTRRLRGVFLIIAFLLVYAAPVIPVCVVYALQ